MKIEIKCFATLAQYAPREGMLDVNEGITVAGVITLLGIPEDEVRIRFINGVHVEPDALVANGDRLGLFPAVGGG